MKRDLGRGGRPKTAAAVPNGSTPPVLAVLPGGKNA